MASTLEPAIAAEPAQAAGRGGGPPTGLETGSSASSRPPRRLGLLRRTIREVGFALITAGVILLLFVGYQLWGTGIAEAHSQATLKRDFTAQLAHQPSGADAPTVGTPTPAQPSAPTGQALAHLVIPKIGVDKYVVNGIDDDQLRKGPGHYPQTSMPGQSGNSAIAGHRTTYGAPFYRLNELRPGDEIHVTTTLGTFLYVVSTSMVVKPSDVAVLRQTIDNRLTLTTCNPRFEATTRLVVVAELTGQPVHGVVAAGAPLVSGTPLAAGDLTLGSGDKSAWPPTILYGLAFLALWVGIRIWSAVLRSWRWVPFAIGIPICLAPLWFSFENVIRLLPANI